MFSKIIEFTKLLQQFREVKRMIIYATSDVPENDAEHSFQLAMIAWYIVELKKLPLDIGKILKYALVHDLVEVYAWDTLPFDAKSILVLTKREREANALERIESEFPDAKNIFQRIHEYEERSNEEAKFVYALDKIVPQYNIIIDAWKSWKKYNVWRAELKNHMEKSRIHPDIYELCWEIHKAFDTHPERFNKL